jgi:hypothetical protein
MHQLFIGYKKAYDSDRKEVLYPHEIGKANKNVSE